MPVIWQQHGRLEIRMILWLKGSKHWHLWLSFFVSRSVQNPKIWNLQLYKTEKRVIPHIGEAVTSKSLFFLFKKLLKPLIDYQHRWLIELIKPFSSIKQHYKSLSDFGRQTIISQMTKICLPVQYCSGDFNLHEKNKPIRMHLSPPGSNLTIAPDFSPWEHDSLERDMQKFSAHPKKFLG